MLYTVDHVKDNIRNRDGRRVFYLGRGDQLTSSARDYLCWNRIEILPAAQAGVQVFRLLDGGTLPGKPEHMTHLNAQVLVTKDHPRIRFRGKLDTLESELILCQLELPSLTQPLGQILALARKIMACDVLEEPLKDTSLCGLEEDQIRKRSHIPQQYYGQPHFMPEHTDGEAVVRLNRLRCIARETEVAAVCAFRDDRGDPTRPDLLQAMNRMSSMLYLLMIEQKAKL